MDAIVFYHANCTDGFGAAWAFRKTAGKLYNSTYSSPVSYGQDISTEIENLTKKEDVFILDFSFPPDILRRMCERADHVTLIDHHKTALPLLEIKNFPSNLSLHIKTYRSGAALTWNYFADGQPPPPLILYIEDRDLWVWELPFSREVNTYIKSKDFYFAEYDILSHELTSDFNTVVQKGEAQLVCLKKIHEGIVRDCTRTFSVNGHQVPVCNCPGVFASEVGEILARTVPHLFAATYYQDKEDSVKFSLRSAGDFDVSEIAKLYGGGGHKNAAGFTLHPVLAAENSEGGVRLWSL